MAVQSLNLTHTSYGVAMWLLAAFGGLCVLLFILMPLLIFVGIGLLVVALGLNVGDDRALDAQARLRAQDFAARAVRCPTCRNALTFDPSTGRMFCPNCRTYYGPPAGPAPPPPPPQ